MMMEFIDTHAHIYLDQFDKDRHDTIQRSIDAGVNKIYLPNIDHDSIDAMLELEHLYPDHCIPMMGLHPCSVDQNFEKQLYEVENWLNKRKFVAVGEMGTDLYWDKSKYKYQVEAFKIQCHLAIQHKIPIVIHCRESLPQTIELVREIGNDNLFGVFHCFGGTYEEARQVRDLGFYLGIGGVLTFKNGGLKENIKEIGLEKLVLETDSPYLTPAPHRGKRNQPSYIPIIAQHLADTFGQDIVDIAESTTNNARKLFQVDEL